jgi:FSR family fosmidomycin resistance protein-like MFS transporter
VGLGSSVFHPEASRMARLASGGRHGMAQSLFQVGGNFGTALGPLLAAFIVLRYGQRSVAWFSLAAMLAMIVLVRVGNWYSRVRRAKAKARGTHAEAAPTLTRRQIGLAIVVLLTLIFSKYFYLASLTSYYTFYLMHKFGVSVQTAQLLLFVFLGAVAVGTIIGGPVGDRIGRKYVIWCSILGVLPFTLALPFANLFWTAILTIVIGVVLASAFSAIVVYAQELMPGRVGTVAGLFFGFAFGMGGVGAAVLGELADWTSIDTVYTLCSLQRRPQGSASECAARTLVQSRQHGPGHSHRRPLSPCATRPQCRRRPGQSRPARPDGGRCNAAGCCVPRRRVPPRRPARPRDPQRSASPRGRSRRHRRRAGGVVATG